MARHEQKAKREERREQLVDLWRQGKKGQSAVLSLCHGALPEGAMLQAGMSVFDVIIDHEFGPRQDELTSPGSQGA